MKIQQNCDKVQATGLRPTELPENTVFKCKNGTITWLKTSVGYFNFNNNLVHAFPYFSVDTTVDIVYPNARIVLE